MDSKEPIGSGAGEAAHPNGPAVTAAPSPNGGRETRFVELPPQSFAEVAAKLTEGVKQLRALVVNPTRYSPEQRKHSGGRLRNGEAPMLQKVLEVARKYPGAFESLADLDFGRDPNVFEVDLVSDRLDKAALLTPIVDEVNALLQDLGDSVLDLNATGREPASEAYVIAKALARTNPIVSSMIADVVGYYGASARAAAASRKAKATGPSPTSPATQPGGPAAPAGGSTKV